MQVVAAFHSEVCVQANPIPKLAVQQQAVADHTHAGQPQHASHAMDGRRSAPIPQPPLQLPPVTASGPHQVMYPATAGAEAAPMQQVPPQLPALSPASAAVVNAAVAPGVCMPVLLLGVPMTPASAQQLTTNLPARTQVQHQPKAAVTVIREAGGESQAGEHIAGQSSVQESAAQAGAFEHLHPVLPGCPVPQQQQLNALLQSAAGPEQQQQQQQQGCIPAVILPQQQQQQQQHHIQETVVMSLHQPKQQRRLLQASARAEPIERCHSVAPAASGTATQSSATIMQPPMADCSAAFATVPPLPVSPASPAAVVAAAPAEPRNAIKSPRIKVSPHKQKPAATAAARSSVRSSADMSESPVGKRQQQQPAYLQEYVVDVARQVDSSHSGHGMQQAVINSPGRHKAAVPTARRKKARKPRKRVADCILHNRHEQGQQHIQQQQQYRQQPQHGSISAAAAVAHAFAAGSPSHGSSSGKTIHKQQLPREKVSGIAVEAHMKDQAAAAPAADALDEGTPPLLSAADAGDRKRKQEQPDPMQQQRRLPPVPLFSAAAAAATTSTAVMDPAGGNENISAGGGVSASDGGNGSGGSGGSGGGGGGAKSKACKPKLFQHQQQSQQPLSRRFAAELLQLQQKHRQASQQQRQQRYKNSWQQQQQQHPDAEQVTPAKAAGEGSTADDQIQKQQQQQTAQHEATADPIAYMDGKGHAVRTTESGFARCFRLLEKQQRRHHRQRQQQHVTRTGTWRGFASVPTSVQWEAATGARRVASVHAVAPAAAQNPQTAAAPVAATAATIAACEPIPAVVAATARDVEQTLKEPAKQPGSVAEQTAAAAGLRGAPAPPAQADTATAMLQDACVEAALKSMQPTAVAAAHCAQIQQTNPAPLAAAAAAAVSRDVDDSKNLCPQDALQTAADLQAMSCSAGAEAKDDTAADMVVCDHTAAPAVTVRHDSCGRLLATTDLLQATAGGAYKLQEAVTDDQQPAAAAGDATAQGEAEANNNLQGTAAAGDDGQKATSDALQAAADVVPDQCPHVSAADRQPATTAAAGSAPADTNHNVQATAAAAVAGGASEPVQDAVTISLQQRTLVAAAPAEYAPGEATTNTRQPEVSAIVLEASQEEVTVSLQDPAKAAADDSAPVAAVGDAEHAAGDDAGYQRDEPVRTAQQQAKAAAAAACVDSAEPGDTMQQPAVDDMPEDDGGRGRILQQQPAATAAACEELGQVYDIVDARQQASLEPEQVEHGAHLQQAVTAAVGEASEEAGDRIDLQQAAAAAAAVAGEQKDEEATVELKYSPAAAAGVTYSAAMLDESPEVTSSAALTAPTASATSSPPPPIALAVGGTLAAAVEVVKAAAVVASEAPTAAAAGAAAAAGEDVRLPQVKRRRGRPPLAGAVSKKTKLKHTHEQPSQATAPAAACRSHGAPRGNNHSDPWHQQQLRRQRQLRQHSTVGDSEAPSSKQDADRTMHSAAGLKQLRQVDKRSSNCSATAQLPQQQSPWGNASVAGSMAAFRAEVLAPTAKHLPGAVELADGRLYLSAQNVCLPAELAGYPWECHGVHFNVYKRLPKMRQLKGDLLEQ